MLTGRPTGFIGRSWREPEQSEPSANGVSYRTVDCYFELDDDGHEDHLDGVSVELFVTPGDQLAMF